MSLPENITANAALSVFDFGEHTITVVTSMMSGRERVFVDDQLVSDKRSFRYHSCHTFALDGRTCDIRVRVKSIWRGPYIIEFRVDDHLVDSDEWDLQRIINHVNGTTGSVPKRQFWTQFLAYVLIGGGIGALFGYGLAMMFKG